jgi:A/G-specific adenine glycosylase
MWEFPNRVGEGKQGREALKSLLAERGILLMDTVAKRKPVKQIKHVFSHKVWQMSVYKACVEESVADGPVLPSDWRWVPVHELTDYNLAGPHNRIFRELLM